MTSLAFPVAKKNQPAKAELISFKVHGQTLSDLRIQGDIDKDYPNGSRLGTVKAWGRLMAHVGNALGSAAADNKIPLFHIVFEWQQSATIRDRPVTPLDLELEGCQIVVIDLSLWSREPQILCPRIKDDKACGGVLTKKGWVDNATSSKGLSSHHTLYLACCNRYCRSCSAEIPGQPTRYVGQVAIQHSVMLGCRDQMDLAIPSTCTLTLLMLRGD